MQLQTLEDLRQYVQQTICERAHLLAGAFRFDEQILKRHGKPCGLQFTLNGPRCVQFTAIWDAIGHSILFYDCSGERFLRSVLSSTSQLSSQLAELAANRQLVSACDSAS